MKTNMVLERIQVDAQDFYYHEHEARYQFARSFTRPGWTLDIACGSGYGSNMLAQQFQMEVIGADIDVPTLVQTRKQYTHPCLSFMAASGTTLPFPTRQFENIVSFETIEHIPDVHACLRELTRVMRSEGVCILSTPNRLYSESIKRKNPYHVREYAYEEFFDLLQDYFANIDFYYQGFSQRYGQQMQDYASEIQSRKRSLPHLVQWAIDHVYRPFKYLIPTTVTNRFIRRWLRVSYPQPETRDITISHDPLPKVHVFVAVCGGPRNTV